MQDIESTIRDRNLNTEEAIRLVKEFSEGSTKDNINFYLEVTDKLTIEGLFENLKKCSLLAKMGNKCLWNFIVKHKVPRNLSKNLANRFYK